MKTSFRSVFATVLAGVALAGVLHASATSIVQGPIQTDGQAKPNVIFGMDDSGSMDAEVLIDGTSDGMLWWDHGKETAWNSAGKPIFMAPTGNNGSFVGYGLRMGYLFPNGCDTNGGATRNYCDDSGVISAVPPIPKFATARSASYNPLYYDPNLTYAPWPKAYFGGSTRTYGNASTTAALSHPGVSGSPSMNLTVQQSSRASNFTFRMANGMLVPPGAEYRTKNTNNSWTTAGSSGKAVNNTEYDVNIPYWPASYWHKQACSVDGTTCVQAPDGATLKYYQIAGTGASSSFPSGRSAAEELQNFANWFQYYRKRKLMLAASMGQVLSTLSGMRLGLTSFNSDNHGTSSNLTMYDTDDSRGDAYNAKVIAGRFYTNDSLSGTPTRETLNYIGQQFIRNKNVVQYSCQRNAAFIVTDGFANGDAVTPAAGWNAANSAWAKTAPFTKTWAGTLADIALYYYTTNVRTDLAAGRVPAATESTDPGADKNNNLHMNTYGITLNATGNIWPDITNPYTTAITWKNVTASGSPDSIDDLWHATINGRGQMFLATNPKNTAAQVQAALTEILRLSGSQSGVTYSTVNLRANESYAFAGSYKYMGWSGDFEEFAVNAATGALASTSTWSASAVLQDKDWTTRKLVTYSGGTGVAFSTGQASTLVDYLRGDRSNEGTTYRARTGLLGAVINADVAVSARDGVVYGPTNEGFLHAFDLATGEELWAYAPSFGQATMVASATPGWTFVTILDGTPVLGTVGTRKVLVGGRGSAGVGYYALDVTDPKTNATEADVAKRVLWEFPNANTPKSVSDALGVSMGKPVIVRTSQWGDVVLLSSGYNSSLDGKGRLFVLDALTGDLKATLITTAGTASADSGLGPISGWQEADGTVQFVYGGDELGNLWRFDLVKSSVLKLATLTNAAGTGLPITAAPELSNVGNRRMVFVGTGRLLGTPDLDDNKVYSFFGLWDNGSAVTNVRTQLAGRTIAVKPDGTRSVSGAAVNWATQRGWYADLPAGEKANTDPAVAFGAISFTTNKASATSCSSDSALYVAASATGLQLPDTAFAGTPYYGVSYSSVLSSDVSVALTSGGKVVLSTRGSNGTNNSRTLNLGGSIPAQKTSWREVLR
jgi:type IV pilus assembly protein PilY1